jgi:hypothetical protein
MWILGTLKATAYLKVRAGGHTRATKADIRQAAQDDDRKKFAILSVATPLVIFDGLLYEAYIEGDRIEINPAEHLVYSCHYVSGAYQGHRSLVDVVTLEYLPEYIDEHRDWLQRMADYMRYHPQIVPKGADK